MIPIHIRKKLSHRTGVYIFRNSQKSVIYVGKAVDLYRRVAQYFAHDDEVDEKTKQLHAQISDVDTIETMSEFEALLLEAKLIRMHKPKYNSISKDDKSPLYIAITLSEILPHIAFLRGRDIEGRKWSSRDAIFGPFQSTHVTHMLLKHIRTSIPYCLQKRRDGKPCFYTHIGLCSPCPSVIEKLSPGSRKTTHIKEYRKNIYGIKNILSGKITEVLHSLEKEMVEIANNQEFEKAQGIKKQTEGLYSLYKKTYNPGLYLSSSQFLTDVGNNEVHALSDLLYKYFPSMRTLGRIECIDISNTSGLYATGSLVVLIDGLIDTSQYRRFKIQIKHVPNDVYMIGEVLRRRMTHQEWGKPDLIIVDGGKPQVSKAKKVLANMNKDIPVIGLAKKYEEIILIKQDKFITIRLPWSNLALHLIIRIRDEAHRFARSYHRHLRSKNFLTA